MRCAGRFPARLEWTESGLAPGGVRPPGAGRCPLHEVDDGDEGVEHARVLSTTGLVTQRPVQGIAVARSKVAGVAHTERAQVCSQRGPDVGQLLQRMAVRRTQGLWQPRVPPGPGLAGGPFLGHKRSSGGVHVRLYISMVFRIRPTAMPSSSKSASSKGTTMVW
jgi:hypothetical protein